MKVRGRERCAMRWHFSRSFFVGRKNSSEQQEKEKRGKKGKKGSLVATKVSAVRHSCANLAVIAFRVISSWFSHSFLPRAAYLTAGWLVLDRLGIMIVYHVKNFDELRALYSLSPNFCTRECVIEFCRSKQAESSVRIYEV